MTPSEFTERMSAIYGDGRGYDEEAAHSASDDLMCDVLTELGYGEGVAILEDKVRWCA